MELSLNIYKMQVEKKKKEKNPTLTKDTLSSSLITRQSIRASPAVRSTSKYR